MMEGYKSWHWYMYIDMDITKRCILAVGTSDIGILTETKVPVIKV